MPRFEEVRREYVGHTGKYVLVDAQNKYSVADGVLQDAPTNGNLMAKRLRVRTGLRMMSRSCDGTIIAAEEIRRRNAEYMQSEEADRLKGRHYDQIIIDDLVAEQQARFDSIWYTKTIFKEKK